MTMVAAASFGSVNVDRVRRVSDDRVAELAASHDWFPAAGETVRLEDPPEGLRDPDEIHLGGKGANQAVAAASAGADARMYGAIGADATRFGVHERLAERGVDPGPLATVETWTGTAHVWVTPDGENRIAIEGGANATLGPDYAAEFADAMVDAGALLLQNEIPAVAMDAILERFDAADGPPPVVFDPAPAPGSEELLGHDALAVITPNESEYAHLEPALATFDGTVVVTLGAAGVRVEQPDGTTWTLDAPSVDVVDTTGAGDAFAGYLAADVAAGAALRDCVERAVAAGALSTTRAGAQAAPERERVESFLAD